MKILGRRFDTGEVVAVETNGETIQRIQPSTASGDVPWIAPGLVDLQVNGFAGFEFTDPELTVERIVRISRASDAWGVTRFCPTVTTQSPKTLSHAMRTLARALRESADVARRVAGIHLEGPYISRDDGPRGAHPLEYCRAPDWDEFRRLQDDAEGNIRILTVSPEYPGSADFIARVTAAGVLVAIGHANVSAAQIQEAVAAGARMSTHLGNGAHGVVPRHPNYIWDQLAEDRLVASLIVDGHHLPPAVVQCFVRAKTPDRCVLISDVVGLAGMPPGCYPSGKAGMIEVLDDGRLVIAGQRQYLFGAGLPITHGVANVMRFARVDLVSAIRMASERPARLLGRTAARIEPGAPAELILFDLPREPGRPIGVRATINGGELVFGSL